MLLNELLCVSKVPPGVKHVDLDLSTLPPTTAMAVVIYNRWWVRSTHKPFWGQTHQLKKSVDCLVTVRVGTLSACSVFLVLLKGHQNHSAEQLSREADQTRTSPNEHVSSVVRIALKFSDWTLSWWYEWVLVLYLSQVKYFTTGERDDRKHPRCGEFTPFYLKHCMESFDDVTDEMSSQLKEQASDSIRVLEGALQLKKDFYVHTLRTLDLLAADAAANGETESSTAGLRISADELHCQVRGWHRTHQTMWQIWRRLWFIRWAFLVWNVFQVHYDVGGIFFQQGCTDQAAFQKARNHFRQTKELLKKVFLTQIAYRKLQRCWFC